MDMENSRRSLDRSREPGAKKPRLIDELDSGSNPTARLFTQPRQPPPSAVSTVAAAARFRVNSDINSESTDSGGYHPQPLTPHQELVNQYKTALAELTFNSKPIITNLTIIAGENLSAAKAIAGSVCNNILEVPSEQKLPSLYLLDSIVKNIGRDYIKYFAARLPEVFCKAYRQVDPPVHSSMRHLFGTWKGVFPPQTLHMIEKELGLTPAVNGSASASAILRSDSQSQRPAHSIHVNPKYLERQRLQQSSRTKGVVDNMTEATLNSNEDPEKPDRALGASRPWLDPRINMHSNQRTQRDAFNDSVPEKSAVGSYGGIEYSSDMSSKLGSGIGRPGSRVTELGHDKAWYKAGSGVEETISGQKNGFSFKHGLSNPETKFMNLDAHHQPTQNITNIRSSEPSNNWKNSEEEEFVWDEMNSGITADGASNVLDNLNTNPWTADDEILGSEDHLQITHPFRVNVGREISTVKKQRPAFGEHSSLSWQLQEQQSINKLNLKPGHSGGVVSTIGGLRANTNALTGRMGNQSFMLNATIGIDDITGQQQFDSVGAESASGQSPLRQQSPSLPITGRHPHPMRNLAEKDPPQALKKSQFLGGLKSQYSRDRPPAPPPNVQVGNLHRSREKDLQGTLSSVTKVQPWHQQQQLGSSQTEVNVKTKKLPHCKVSLASETSEQSTTSSLTAAAANSGAFSNKSIISSFPSTSSMGTRNLPSELGVQPPRAGRSSPATLTSSGSAVASPPSLGPANDDSSTLSKIPQVKAGQRPRVSTQLSASSDVRSAPAPTSKATNNNPVNPISNLLSSLVAKGLISAETESQTKVPTEVLVRLEDQTESISASSTLAVASVSSSAAVPVPSSRDEVGDTKTTIALSQSTSTEIRNIIGFDFKPDVIREFHPTVIKGLLDDLPHHCEVCGIRLKQQEQFDRHVEWHATREREQNGLIIASRKWYAKPNDWIAGKADYPPEVTDFVDVDGEKTDRSELDTMVLADENQCLCVLCGELFEDVYCQESDGWMFNGAVFVSNMDIESINVGPIVHAKCLSETSISGFSKMEQD